MLDFATIKAIPITQVLARYGISLRFNGEWGSAPCPLPSHKPNDRDKTFQVSTSGNYWKCWSASCNEKAGAKGGDCINFVALKEGISQFNAAKKLAEMFNLNGKEKPAPQIEKRAPEKVQSTNPQRNSLDHTSQSDSVKYMASIDLWYDEVSVLLPDESDEDHRKRILKGLKAKLIESYKAGQKARS